MLPEARKAGAHPNRRLIHQCIGSQTSIVTAWLSRLPWWRSHRTQPHPPPPSPPSPPPSQPYRGGRSGPAAGGGTGQAGHRPSMAALTTASDRHCCRCRQSCCARAPVWSAGWVSPSHRRRRVRGLCPSACLERLSTRVRSVLRVPSSEICSRVNLATTGWF